MRTAYLTHPDCLKHDMGAHHPECPARMGAIEDRLHVTGLFNFLKQVEAPKASKEELKRAHTNDYVEWVFNHAPKSGIVHLDGDTAMNPHSLDAALRAAGAAIKAVDLVMSGVVDNAFGNVRPPGHHAGHASAAGFCIFNNVAVAAFHALKRHNLQRIAIADFDVHHGNGTEDIFHDDPLVLLCSTFRHPYYPYSGNDSGNDHIINVPLVAGTKGKGFRAAITEHWLPVLEQFKPELLLISAGFDAHREDDMGGLALDETDYSWITQTLMDIASRHCKGRIVSMLEGGYALNALGRCVSAHIKTLSGL